MELSQPAFTMNLGQNPQGRNPLGQNPWKNPQTTSLNAFIFYWNTKGVCSFPGGFCPRGFYPRGFCPNPSTDISEPEDLTSFDKSDTVLEIPDKGSLDLSQPTAVSTITTKMSQKELARSEFKQMELKISDMCSDLDPSLITTQSAPSMDK